MQQSVQQSSQHTRRLLHEQRAPAITGQPIEQPTSHVQQPARPASKSISQRMKQQPLWNPDIQSRRLRALKRPPDMNRTPLPRQFIANRTSRTVAPAKPPPRSRNPNTGLCPSAVFVSSDASIELPQSLFPKFAAQSLNSIRIMYLVTPGNLQHPSQLKSIVATAFVESAWWRS